MTKLYIADISGLDIETELEKASAYRREKALRLKRDSDRRRSLGAEHLLRRAFGEDFTYRIGEYGKPCADGVFFSLSHSGSFAVCAVGDCEIGIDIEAPRENPLPLAKRFFTEEEYEKIAAGENPEEDFCALWVIKEACLKCGGQGLRSLTSTDISAYSTRHFVYEGYHIGIASAEALGSIEIILEKL